MKRSSTLILKVVLCLIAIGTLAGMLWFPQTEGRATNLDLISIYADPLIIYTYIASIPFFIGLYQAFKLLNLIDANKAFSQGAVNTLKNMKFASLSLIGFIALALFYIRFFAPLGVDDDPAHNAWSCRVNRIRCDCHSRRCLSKASPECCRHKIRK